MRLLQEIKERRLIPLMGAYIVTGFVALEAVDQLVSYAFVPAWAYPVTLVLYIYGIPGSLIFAWFHGAPGRQSTPQIEVVLQSIVGILAVATTISVYRSEAARGGPEGTGLPPDRVAVLYFDDLSPGGELAPVADGITEALIDQLDAVSSLDVVSSNGVLPFRETDIRSDSIARVLEVGTIIDGGVERVGDQLRITTRLVDGLSGADIERALVEIPAGAFLAARDSVADRVSRLLRQRLGEEVQLRQLRAGTDSPEAWALAQRAERLRTDAEDNFEAGGALSVSIDAFVQADSLLALAEGMDPDWVNPIAARAHAAYRRAFLAATSGDLDEASREVAVGLEHADRALEMDPDHAEALEARGTLKVFAAAATASSREERQALIQEASADLDAAIEEDPTLATAHAMRSFLAAGEGDDVGAVLSARRALEEDAYLRGADRIYDRLFYANYDLNQLRDARNWCQEGYRRFPDNFRFTECRLWLTAAPRQEADIDEAWALLARLDSLAPESLRDFKHGVGQIMVAGAIRKAAMAVADTASGGASQRAANLLVDSANSVLARVDSSEDVDPQSQLLVYEAAIRATTGDPEGAIRVLRRWIAVTPGSTLGSGDGLHWWWSGLRGRPDFEPFVGG